MKEIAKRAIDGILEAYKKHKLVDYLNDVLEIRICESWTGEGWELEQIELQLTTGGPNTWLVITPNLIRTEVYWGTKKVEQEYVGEEVEDIFDILADAIAHK